MNNLQTFDDFLNESKIVYNFDDIDVNELKIRRNRGTYYPEDTNQKLDMDKLRAMYTPKAVADFSKGMMDSEKKWASSEKKPLSETMYEDFSQSYEQNRKANGMPADYFADRFVTFVQTCLRYNLRYAGELLMK